MDLQEATNVVVDKRCEGYRKHARCTNPPAGYYEFRRPVGDRQRVALCSACSREFEVKRKITIVGDSRPEKLDRADVKNF